MATKVTKIIGKPTALDIANLERQLIENAGNMTNAKSKQFGHVGMLMSHEEYEKFAENSGVTGTLAKWQPPKESGARPEYIKGDKLHEHKQLVDDWAYNNEVEKEYTNGWKEIKGQIIEAVEAQYLRKVRNATDTTHGKGPKELLDHLKATYGVVTGREIAANRKKLAELWDGKTPITEMWEKVADIRQLAIYAKSPISDNECIMAVLEATENLTNFADVVRKYHRTLPVNWNYDDMVTEFTAVDGGRDNKTTGEKGYHAANAASATKTSPTKKDQPEHVLPHARMANGPHAQQPDMQVSQREPQRRSHSAQHERRQQRSQLRHQAAPEKEPDRRKGGKEMTTRGV